jgi:hypothetical protein
MLEVFFLVETAFELLMPANAAAHAPSRRASSRLLDAASTTASREDMKQKSTQTAAR